MLDFSAGQGVTDQTFGEKTSRERTWAVSWLSSWAQRRISAAGSPDPSLRSGWQAFSPNVW